MKSVQDPSLASPFVPASVFTGVKSSDYWSATTIAALPSFRWAVGFFSGFVNGGGRTGDLYAWCVRGGMHADAY